MLLYRLSHALWKARVSLVLPPGPRPSLLHKRPIISRIDGHRGDRKPYVPRQLDRLRLLLHILVAVELTVVSHSASPHSAIIL